MKSFFRRINSLYIQLNIFKSKKQKIYIKKCKRYLNGLYWHKPLRRRFQHNYYILKN